MFEAVLTIGGRVLSIFLVIATTKFLTVFLSEADYGKLSLYNVSATLPGTFFFGPLGQGLMRYYSIAKGKNEFGAFHQEYHTLYRMGGWWVFALGVSISLFCYVFHQTEWSIAVLLMTGYSIVSAGNTFQYGLQNAARNRTLAMGLETSDRLLQQGLAIFLLWQVFSDPLIVFAGFLVSSLIFYLVNQYFYKKSFPETALPASETETRFYRKGILNYSWPFIVFGLFTWVQNASDRWTLEILQSTELVGQYAVLNQIGFQSLGLLFGSIGYFLVPIMFNRAGNLSEKKQFDDANRVNDMYLKFNILLTLGLFLIFWLWGETVIRLLSAEKYVKLADFLPFMVLAGGLFNFGQNYANRFMLSMQTNLLIYPKVIAAIAGILLNIAFISWFGLSGLVVAVIITQIIYVFTMLILWKWKGHLNLSE